MENGVVRRTDDDYAAVYRRSRPSASGLDPEAVHLFTDRVRANWDTVEEIVATVDPEGT